MNTQNTSQESTQEQGVVINGEVEPGVPAGISLIDLLNRRGIDPKEAAGVAVAVNEEVVSRNDWKDTMVGEGDRVEIVSATQGG